MIVRLSVSVCLSVYLFVSVCVTAYVFACQQDCVCEREIVGLLVGLRGCV